DAFIDTVTHIAPTFGGINLEDIAAPYCFEIERVLTERLDIPVFHDDQHGTAIIISAGLLNALELQGKSLAESRIVCLGAGAAAIASMRLLVRLGAEKNNIVMIDRKGVLYHGRGDINIYKEEFTNDTGARTLEDAMHGADVVIGVSGPNLISQAMIKSMADHPVVFALSNPDPEITPAEVHAVRKDVIMATGRSDYPNQVNNVLGFPFIFRGALDVQASRINIDMQVAAVHALAQLAHAPVPDSVLKAYGKKKGSLCFGPDYIIPTPFDPRLKDYIPPAVARAAVGTGVARIPYPAHYPQLGT
ncbi:MAG: malate dehydrogenase, partial [Gammaproteobacteria bacterium]|nr:malate dehydrogenase [Gammaproteobacteria bacterium]